MGEGHSKGPGFHVIVSFGFFDLIQEGKWVRVRGREVRGREREREREGGRRQVFHPKQTGSQPNHHHTHINLSPLYSPSSTPPRRPPCLSGQRQRDRERERERREREREREERREGRERERRRRKGEKKGENNHMKLTISSVTVLVSARIPIYTGRGGAHKWFYTRGLGIHKSGRGE